MIVADRKNARIFGDSGALKIPNWSFATRKKDAQVLSALLTQIQEHGQAKNNPICTDQRDKENKYKSLN